MVETSFHILSLYTHRKFSVKWSSKPTQSNNQSKTELCKETTKTTTQYHSLQHQQTPTLTRACVKGLSCVKGS